MHLILSYLLSVLHWSILKHYSTNTIVVFFFTSIWKAVYTKVQFHLSSQYINTLCIAILGIFCPPFPMTPYSIPCTLLVSSALRATFSPATTLTSKSEKALKATKILTTAPGETSVTAAASKATILTAQPQYSIEIPPKFFSFCTYSIYKKIKLQYKVHKG